MAFNGAPAGTISSDPIQTKVGTNQTNIFTATSTKVTQGAGGNVNGGTTTLFFSPSPDNYVPAATTTDGGKTWTYLKDSSGKEILGADAKKSLEQGALKTNTQQQIISASTKASIPKEQQKVLAIQTQNTTQTPSSPDAQSGSTPAPDASKPQTQAQTTSSGGGDVFVYPIEMRKTQQDRLKFTAVEYQPSGNLSAGTLSSQNRTSAGDKTILGTVFLPIQPSISDFNSVNWQEGNLNAIDKYIAGKALNGMNTPLDKVEELAVGTAKDILGTFSKHQNEAKVYLAQEAASIQNLLGRFGTVLNPNLELLFSGPQLRPFQFDFKMSAREQKEGENIKAIINFFKKNMAVKKSDGTAIFLKAPNTFLIEYKYNGADATHPGINLIKECALLSCSVEYTPLGTYMTYPDGTMVSYNMSLSFTELEPIYDVDYVDHPIGY
jgi:hypothetical protein